MLTFQAVRCLDYCWKSYCHNNFRKFEQPPVITTTFDPHDSSPLVLLSSHLGQAAHHPEPQAVLLPLKAALPPGRVPQEQIYPQSCQSSQSSPQLCYIRNIQNPPALTPLWPDVRYRSKSCALCVCSEEEDDSYENEKRAGVIGQLNGIRMWIVFIFVIKAIKTMAVSFVCESEKI